MEALPEGIRKYAETPIFNEASVPDKLIVEHNLKEGVWGRLSVFEGCLEYHVPGGTQKMRVIAAGSHAVIEPVQVHFVRPIGHVRFQVEFYR